MDILVEVSKSYIAVTDFVRTSFVTDNFVRIVIVAEKTDVLRARVAVCCVS